MIFFVVIKSCSSPTAWLVNVEPLPPPAGKAWVTYIVSQYWIISYYPMTLLVFRVSVNVWIPNIYVTFKSRCSKTFKLIKANIFTVCLSNQTNGGHLICIQTAGTWHLWQGVMPLYSSPNVSAYCMNNTLIHDAPTNGTPTCQPSVSPAHWLKEMTDSLHPSVW